jgi:hypothetical protein
MLQKKLALSITLFPLNKTTLTYQEQQSPPPDVKQMQSDLGWRKS